MKINIDKKGLELVIYQLTLSEKRLQKRIDNFHVSILHKQGMQNTLNQIVKQRVALESQLNPYSYSNEVINYKPSGHESYDDIWKEVYPKLNKDNQNKATIINPKPNLWQQFMNKLQTSK